MLRPISILWSKPIWRRSSVRLVGQGTDEERRENAAGKRPVAAYLGWRRSSTILIIVANGLAPQIPRRRKDGAAGLKALRHARRLHQGAYPGATRGSAHCGLQCLLFSRRWRVRNFGALRPSTICRSKSARARRSAFSDRTAPARARCSISSAATSARPPAPFCCAGGTLPACRLTNAVGCGIGRSYQIPQPFGRMTVFENVLAAASFASGTARAACYDLSVDALDRTGLLNKSNFAAGALTLLERKRLELARALATKPRASAARRNRRRADRRRVS